MTFALIFIANHIDKIHTLSNETALLTPSHRCDSWICRNQACHSVLGIEVRSLTESIHKKWPLLATSCIVKGNGNYKYKNMDSRQLAQYMEATDSITKPWLLVQLRLKKLQERQAMISEDEYANELQDIHQDLMNLGEWWRGIEDEVF